MPHFKPATAVTLGGIPVLASGPVVWEIAEGTAPVSHSFSVRPQDANALIGRRGPVDLVIQAGTDAGERVVFRGLTILSEEPGANPKVRSVRVADRRWAWPYRHVGPRRYNIRRKVGTKRPVSPNAALQETLPDFWFARYSLRDAEGVPPAALWTAPQVLDDVVTALRTKEAEVGLNFPVVVEPGAAQFAQPIEDLEIDDRGDQALGLILSSLPGAGCFVDANGALVFYQRATNLEAAIFATKKGFEHEHQIAFINHAIERPRGVRVLFSYEAELRFDFLEQSADSTTVVRFPESTKETERLLDNVIPLPDFTLELNGLPEHQGTWVEIKDLLAAWGNPPAGAPPVDLAVIRKGILPFVDLAAGLIPPNHAEAQRWGVRIAAILEHYRRTFRLPQRWMDRILSLRAYRAGIVDQATGSRAPAGAYCDFAYMRPAPVLIKFNTGEANASQALFGINVQGYPRETPFTNHQLGFREIGASAFPVGLVQVIDQDQGILQIQYPIGPAIYFTQIIPGEVKDGTMPKVDFRRNEIRNGEPILFNSILGTGGRIPQLSSNWKMAAFITAIPAAPNDERQLFAVDVFPDGNLGPDLRAALPAHVNAGLGAATGPVLDVRVPPSIETARIAWKDSRSADIASLFGVGGRADQRPNVSDLLVNFSIGGTSVVRGPLQRIAIAEAARAYAKIADKVEGSMATHIDASMRPLGNLEAVTFEVAPDGRASVHLRLPKKPAEISMFSFLDAGTRAVIQRLVQGPQA